MFSFVCACKEESVGDATQVSRARVAYIGALEVCSGPRCTHIHSGSESQERDSI